MSEAPGIWFVYRSHYEGPLSRLVRRLDAPSILAWFSQKMSDAKKAEDPSRIYEDELGGYVYGFGTVFEAVKEHGLIAPKSTAELEKILRKHLYVEGDAGHIRIDEHSLRVLTDDDEVELAYFFFDDEVVRKQPERVSFLLQEEPKLPEGDADGSFTPPFEPEPVLPRGEGEGTTYACLLTSYDGDSIPGLAVAIPGVRLPDLASHLRTVVPAKKPASWSKEWLETWPVELRLLRAMIEPGQISIAPALTKCAAYPLREVVTGTNHTLLGVGAHQNAESEFYKVGTAFEGTGDPAQAIVQVGKHAALFCPHTSSAFGHEQWILFDDRWAAAHPALAASMLRYAHGWDPLRDPAPTKPVETAAEQKERAWKEALGGRMEEKAAPYRTTARFAAGDLVDHTKFGRGLVRRVDGAKIEVIFKDGARLLAHAMPG
ncbi:hypothetical protein [Polyangium mundeleinium]|uniref:Uncharacterized protein n=1 Tax=Polyangium mundeleinium TaxID=2995306 RepID=A0ABT5ER32_9BACT|nr:hypothetical protein [Polyangium mundeleinium]MDC0743827.1 hypothetical protein [Polyangium mundeleinium]